MATEAPGDPHKHPSHHTTTTGHGHAHPGHAPPPLSVATPPPSSSPPPRSPALTVSTGGSGHGPVTPGSKNNARTPSNASSFHHNNNGGGGGNTRSYTPRNTNGFTPRGGNHANPNAHNNHNHASSVAAHQHAVAQANAVYQYQHQQAVAAVAAQQAAAAAMMAQASAPSAGSNDLAAAMAQARALNVPPEIFPSFYAQHTAAAQQQQQQQQAAVMAAAAANPMSHLSMMDINAINAAAAYGYANPAAAANLYGMASMSPTGYPLQPPSSVTPPSVTSQPLPAAAQAAQAAAAAAATATPYVSPDMILQYMWANPHQFPLAPPPSPSAAAAGAYAQQLQLMALANQSAAAAAAANQPQPSVTHHHHPSSRAAQLAASVTPGSGNISTASTPVMTSSNGGNNATPNGSPPSPIPPSPLTPGTPSKRINQRKNKLKPLVPGTPPQSGTASSTPRSSGAATPTTPGGRTLPGTTTSAVALANGFFSQNNAAAVMTGANTTPSNSTSTHVRTVTSGRTNGTSGNGQGTPVNMVRVVGPPTVVGGANTSVHAIHAAAVAAMNRAAAVASLAHQQQPLPTTAVAPAAIAAVNAGTAGNGNGVTAVPLLPPQLRIISTSSSTVTIQWHPVDLAISYIVECIPASDAMNPNPSAITVYEGDLPNCIHMGLQPNRAYTYRARSIGDEVLRIYSSDWSLPIAARTTAAPPAPSPRGPVPGTSIPPVATGTPVASSVVTATPVVSAVSVPGAPPPPNVHHKTKKGTAVKVQWQMPAIPNGATVSGFKLQTSERDSVHGPWTDTFTTPPLLKPSAKIVMTHDVGTLLPNHMYYFRVAAMCSNGTQSPYSPATAFRTNPGPPAAPSLPLLAADTPEGLHIQWDAPDNGGSPIVTYSLSMAYVDDATLRAARITPPASPLPGTPNSMVGKPNGISFAAANLIAAATESTPSSSQPSRIPSPSPSTFPPTTSVPSITYNAAGVPLPYFPGAVVPATATAGPHSLSRTTSNSSTASSSSSSSDSKRSSASITPSASPTITPSPSPPAAHRPLPSVPGLSLTSLVWKPVYDGGATSYVLPHSLLAPSTVYVFRVNAINVIGTSPWSDLLIVRSKSAAASVVELPMMITPSKITSNSVQLSWQPQMVNGYAPTGFFVEVNQFEHNGSMIVSKKKFVVRASPYDVIDLVPATTYQFRVQCQTLGGNSKWSTPCNVTTLLPPPSSPRLMTPTGTDHNTVTLSWDPDTIHPGVTWHVEMTYFSANIERKHPHHHHHHHPQESKPQLIYRGPNLSCTSSIISPSTTYSFRLRAVYVEGSMSAWSEPAVIRTKGVRPGLAQPPILVAATAAALKVKWPSVPYAAEYILEMTTTSGVATSTATTLPPVDLSTTAAIATSSVVPTSPTVGPIIISPRPQVGSRKGGNTATIAAATAASMTAAITTPANAATAAAVTAMAAAPHIPTAIPPQPASGAAVPNGANSLAGAHGWIQVYRGTQCVYKLLKLSARTVHRFRVAAVNEEGQGAWCPVVAFTTMPPAPQRPPSPLVEHIPAERSPLNVNSVLIRWTSVGRPFISVDEALATPVDDTNASSPVTNPLAAIGSGTLSYVVERRIRVDEPFEAMYNGQQRHIILPLIQLQTDVAYKFRVSVADPGTMENGVMTSVGTSPPSNDTEFRTTMSLTRSIPAPRSETKTVIPAPVAATPATVTPASVPSIPAPTISATPVMMNVPTIGGVAMIPVPATASVPILAAPVPTAAAVAAKKAKSDAKKAKIAAKKAAAAAAATSAVHSANNPNGGPGGGSTPSSGASSSLTSTSSASDVHSGVASSSGAITTPTIPSSSVSTNGKGGGSRSSTINDDTTISSSATTPSPTPSSGSSNSNTKKKNAKRKAAAAAEKAEKAAAAAAATNHINHSNTNGHSSTTHHSTKSSKKVSATPVRVSTPPVAAVTTTDDDDEDNEDDNESQVSRSNTISTTASSTDDSSSSNHHHPPPRSQSSSPVTPPTSTPFRRFVPSSFTPAQAGAERYRKERERRARSARWSPERFKLLIVIILVIAAICAVGWAWPRISAATNTQQS